MESLAVVVAACCVFGLGMSFSLLGSVSVKLMPRLKIDQGGFGTLVSVFMFTCLVASVIIGLMVDKWGFKALAIVGFVALALAMLALARATTYGLTILACLLLGVGAMCVNTVGNTLLPKLMFGGKNEAAALNFGNVFFGLGLFLSPMLLSFLLRQMPYEKAVSVLGIIVLVPVILAVLAGYPAAPAGFTIGGALTLLTKPAVIVAALALFCYISLEVSLSNWIAPFGKEVITTSGTGQPADAVDATAQRMLSVFAVAMMIGRLTASQLAFITTHGSFVIAGMALLSCLVIFAMTQGKSVGLAWVLVFLAGLFFAPCFPTIVGVTFNKTDPAYAGSIFGTIFAVGLLGAVIIPKAIGNMAKGSTVQQGLRILTVMCLILIVLALILHQFPKFAAVAAAAAK